MAMARRIIQNLVTVKATEAVQGLRFTEFMALGEGEDAARAGILARRILQWTVAKTGWRIAVVRLDDLQGIIEFNKVGGRLKGGDQFIEFHAASRSQRG